MESTGVDSSKSHEGDHASTIQDVGSTAEEARTKQDRNHIDNYDFLKQVGEGAFGYVYLAVEKATQQLCAVKVLEKTHILKNDKTKAVYREKDILMKFSSNPNVIKIDCVFQVCGTQI